MLSIPLSSETPGAKLWQKALQKQGYYEWNVTVAGKAVVARMHPRDVEDYCNWDTSFVWEQFPQETHVLTIHGLADKMVPT